MVTFKYIPHSEIKDLSSAKRVNKLLNIVKENKIILLEGRLTRQEEADLIEITMEEITPKFKGIELSVMYPEDASSIGAKIKQGFVNMLIGDRVGVTIMGPASIVKKVVRNPNTLELYMEEGKKRAAKKRKKRR